MRHRYAARGTCAKSLEFEMEGGLIRDISFEGGCPGNLMALTRLAEGKSAEDLVRLLGGIRCGDKKTSCPDQLARAISKALGKGRKKAGEGLREKP